MKVTKGKSIVSRHFRLTKVHSCKNRQKNQDQI